MQRDPLISVDDLRRDRERATVLDASWIYAPFNQAGIDVRARYAEAHIPGSWFLDLEALSDPRRILDPRVAVVTPPAPHVLRAAMARTGADLDAPIVVTDMDGGCTTAPFARHALVSAGFADVRLLDGGTPAWTEAGGEVTGAGPRVLDGVLDRAPAPTEGERDGVFASLHDLTAALGDAGGAQVVDTRAVPDNEDVLPADYAGLAIPAHVVVPSVSVVEEAGAGQRFRSGDALRRVFADAGVDAGRPKIITCYFGLGSSVVATAMEIARQGGARSHPGSLVEYAVATGRVRPI